MQQYVAELNKLARTCEFKENLAENLRDQFVCGVRSDIIRQRLFAEGELEFAKAVTLACALEAAERDAATVESARSGSTGAGGGTGMHDGSGAEGVLRVTRANSTNQRGARGAAGARGGRAAAAGASRTAPRTSQMTFEREDACRACDASGHFASHCRFTTFKCSLCYEVGHLRRVCPARGGNPGPSMQRRQRNGQRWRNTFQVASDGTTGNLSPDSDVQHNENETEHVYQMALDCYKPVSIPVVVAGREILMEIDSGAAGSYISKTTYEKLFSEFKLLRSKIQFKYLDGTPLEAVGYFTPSIYCNGKRKQLDLYVVDKGETSLIGRQWLAELSINIPQFTRTGVNNVSNSVMHHNQSLNVLLDRFKGVFDGGLGRFTGGTATLRVRPDAVPVFHHARPLPFALKERVDAELDAMVRSGVIEPVECSDWATPLVPVTKKDGGLRVCADFKVTLNPALVVDRYPLPRIEDLFSGLSGAGVYTKIDLSNAYNQVCLSEDSKPYKVINTHRGLFKYNRLVYGLSSSAGIFQRIMSNLIKDIPSTQTFLDDILVTTRATESNLKTLEIVLDKLQSVGLKLKKSKCTFLTTKVSYLGYIISSNGIRPDPDKLSAITKMPEPKNVGELRSFLGIVNFYAKFIKNMTDLLHPLYSLLKKGNAWNWSKECVTAFRQVKIVLSSSEVLAHYDPAKPLTLTCDASSYGIGGVLTQPDTSGTEKLIAYSSRKLSSAEHSYSQIHREALAIVYSVNKFHQYLYGRKFTLKTDHKPLVSIFGPRVGVPSMAASRMQRWALILSGYDFDIQYVKTDNNCADALSRLPIGERNEFEPPEQSYLNFASDALLIDCKEVQLRTARDPLLGRVTNYIRNGWPDTAEILQLRPFFNRRQELYLELGCVMWGHRVVIPQACRNQVLLELHEPHMGIVKTKAMARSYVWWPGIDEDIVKLCESCEICGAVAAAPPASTPVPWRWPSRAYERIHVDFLGPIANKTYLISIDARSKWIEFYPMSSTSAVNTIAKLRESWSRFGIPKQVVSDNGPPFTSKEFNEFLELNGVKHVFSAPFHPTSNGAAEGAVKLIKRVIKKALQGGVNVEEALWKFLLYYHNTPHSTTGESPARLLHGRDLRTRLDVLKPDISAKVHNKQAKFANRSPLAYREMVPGDRIKFRCYGAQGKWNDGVVVNRNGKSDYRVRTKEGLIVHRHIDQLRSRNRGSIAYPSEPHEQAMASPLSPSSTGASVVDVRDLIIEGEGATVEGVCGRSAVTASVPKQSLQKSPESKSDQTENPIQTPAISPAASRTQASPLVHRYPRRNRQPVKRYGFEFD